MAFLVGADPDRLETAARQLNDVSTRLDSTWRQLTKLLLQARGNGPPAPAYSDLASQMPPLFKHLTEARNAVKILNDRALKQRDKSDGQGGRDSGSSGGSSTPNPQFSPEVRRLIETAEGDLEWLRRTADDLRARGDGNFWFAQTYAKVTEGVLAAVKEHRFANPKVVLEDEIGFTNIYRQNLAAWEAGNTNAMFPNWFVADSRIAVLNEDDQSNSLLRGKRRGSEVVLAAQAHILWDLPRVVADVAMREYGPNITAEQIATIRSDFDKMSDIFPKAQEAMKAEILKGTSSADPARSTSLQELLKDSFLPTRVVRRRAFDTAVGIIHGRQAGIGAQGDLQGSAEMEVYLKDKGVLPRNLAGYEIRGYPWQE